MSTCVKHYTLTIDAYDPNNPPLNIYFDDDSFAFLSGCCPGLSQSFTRASFTPNTFVNWVNDGNALDFVDFFPPNVPGGHFTMGLQTNTTQFIADKVGSVWADGPFGLYTCNSGGSCGFQDVRIVPSL